MKILTKGKNKFLGCENYPNCKNTRAILSASIKKIAAEQACPTCGTKPLSARKGRFGEYLYCPQCKVSISLTKLGLRKSRAPRKEREPAQLAEVACPKCQRPTMESRVGKYGPYYRCPDCKVNYSARKLGLSTAAGDA